MDKIHLIEDHMRLIVQYFMDYAHKLFLIKRKVIGLVTKAISNVIDVTYGVDTTYNIEDFDSIYLCINT